MHTLNHSWSDDELRKLKRQGYRMYTHAVDHDVLAFMVQNYQKFKKSHDWRMYNLYGTVRYQTKGIQVIEDECSRMKEEMGMEVCEHYILHYGPGSYTKMHGDPKNCLTYLTMLDVLPNTAGGDTIVHVDDYCPESLFDERHVTQQQYDSVSKKRNLIRPNQIPIVVPHERFHTAVYPPERHHGVSKLTAGARVVFVQWFFKSEKERDTYRSEKKNV